MTPPDLAALLARIADLEATLSAVEAATIIAVGGIGHDSWCSLRGRCNGCDPVDEVAAALAAAGRDGPTKALAASRPTSIEDWRARYGGGG